MVSKPVAQSLAELYAARSHSRPHCSNDCDDCGGSSWLRSIGLRRSLRLTNGSAHSAPFGASSDSRLMTASQRNGLRGAR